MRKLLYTVLALVMTLIMVVPAVAQTPVPPYMVPPNEHPTTVYQWDYPPAFNKVTVNVVGDAGHNLKPYEFWKDDFTKAGVTINLIEVPFEGVYEKEMTEFVAQSGAFDVVTFYPAYIGDFAGNGYIEPLDDYIKKDPASVNDPKMDDILPPFYQLYCRFGGKTYAMAIDGDVLMLQYRKDLFENPDEQAAFKAKYGKDLAPPETWEDWLQVSQFFVRKKGEKVGGQVLDHDFYGSAEFGARGFSVYWFLNRFASTGGMYFDENMKPGITTPAAAAALQNMVDSLKSSPPDTLAYGYDQLRDVFLKGYTAMVIQWSDVPKKAEDPAISNITGNKVGIALVPGTKLADGTINHRSMMPVGRVVAVAKDSQNKDAAYWVAKHVSYDRSLDDVSTMLTGLDPYRTSHFQHPEAFTMFPTKEQAQDYLKGVEANLAHGFPEIFIPGAAAYTDALDVHVQKALTGEEKPTDALAAAAKEWDAITDKLGRDKQIALWKQALESYRALGLVK
jgi:multiple sugar transport system substrate-binding protein